MRPNKLKIYCINTVIDEETDEDNSYKYHENKNEEEQKKMKIDFEKIYETEIELGDDYWKFYLEEINDMYLVFYSDKNEIYLIDVFSDDKELLYKYDEDKINDNNKNKRKVGITKIKYFIKLIIYKILIKLIY